jgi:hypothetical protein
MRWTWGVAAHTLEPWPWAPLTTDSEQYGRGYGMHPGLLPSLIRTALLLNVAHGLLVFIELWWAVLGVEAAL